MTESRVVDLLETWLTTQGWTVHREVAGCDLVATRAGHDLRIEVKGDTTSPGLDVDTAYGQLLRRMIDAPNVTYAIAAPAKARGALVRVPRFVRDRLNLALYVVEDDGTVVEITGPTRVDFDAALAALLRAPGDGPLLVRAGDLHAQVGGYPGPDHRMPVCCDALRAAMRPGDHVVEPSPPGGAGASLTVAYLRPRPA